MLRIAQVPGFQVAMLVYMIAAKSVVSVMVYNIGLGAFSFSTKCIPGMQTPDIKHELPPE